MAPEDGGAIRARAEQLVARVGLGREEPTVGEVLDLLGGLTLWELQRVLTWYSMALPVKVIRAETLRLRSA